MKIAFVTHVFPRLHNTYILNEIVELLRQGEDVAIYSLARSNESIVNADVERYRLFERIHYIEDFPQSEDRSLAPFLKHFYRPEIGLHFPAVAEHLRNEEFDVIHGILGNRPATAAMLLSRLSGVPFSFETHAYDLFVDFPFAEEKLNQASFVTTESTYNRDYLLDAFNASSEKVKIMHLSPNREMLDSVTQHERQKNLIVSACRLHPIKGLSYALRAVANVHKTIPDLKYILLGSGELKEELMREAISLGLRDVVSFVDDVTNEEVGNVVQQASVFLLPSVIAADGDRDGTPTAIAEAMYLETPVVSSRVSGIPELVEDGVTGLLCEPGDSEQIAACLKRLFGDEKLRTEMGRAGREKILREFNVTDNVSKLRSWWQTVVEKPQHTDASSTVDRVLDEHIGSGRYYEASAFALELAQKEGNAERYIEAARYAAAAGAFELAENISEQLCQAGFAEHVTVLRVYALSLLLQGKLDRLAPVLDVLNRIEPDSIWAGVVRETNTEQLLSCLYEAPECEPLVHHARSFGEEHYLALLFDIECRICKQRYAAQLDHSVYRIKFAPCPQCFHPYFIRPSLIADLFASRHQPEKLEELAAIESMITTWSNDWWKGRELPAAAHGPMGNNLLELFSFRARYIVSDMYSRMLTDGRLDGGVKEGEIS